MPRIWVDILTFSAVFTLGLYVLVRYLECVSVFFPSRRITVNPVDAGLPWQDVYFKTQDHLTLNGWFFKNPRAQSTLIFAHGNAGNIGDRLLRVRFFYDLGLSIFIFDYRGYGKSEGRPSEKGIYLDAQAAYDYLQSRTDIDMAKIILYGASLGGAVVVDLATRRKAALLVVESSFTNAADMARRHYHFVPAIFMSIKFDSAQKVQGLGLPKVFIHSRYDQVVPYEIGQQLFSQAKEPKEFLEIHGGHNDGSISTEPLAAAEFIRILKTKDLI